MFTGVIWVIVLVGEAVEAVWRRLRPPPPDTIPRYKQWRP